MNDRMSLLHQVVAANGQATVAKKIGYSVSAVNQALHDKYAGSLENLLKAVAEVYGTGTVECPIIGQITIQQCAAERRKPFGATNPQRARLWHACRQCTAHN